MSPAYTGKGYTKAAVNALIEGYMGPIMRLTHVGAVSGQMSRAADDPGSECGSCCVTSYTQGMRL